MNTQVCSVHSDIWNVTVNGTHLRFHGNDGYANAQQCYVTQTCASYWFVTNPHVVTSQKTKIFKYCLIKSVVCGHRVSQLHVFGIRDGHTSPLPSTGLLGLKRLMLM